MSSKVGQNQPQGRRTPLSLTGGGKHAHQQQQQQHKKANSALATTQELKSDATVVTKNGNNNGAKNQESNNSNQKESKKAAQQNGNGNGNGNGTGSEVVIDLTENANNGTANGHKNNKNNAAKAKIIKEKDNKETEIKKDEPKKSETAKQQTVEKKQTEAAEQPSEQVPQTTTAAKSKDNITAKPNTPTNEKKQTAAASKANANGQKSPTPTKAVEKSTATPPAKSPAASKSVTPSKSPRGAAAAAKNANSSIEATADVDMLPLLVDPSPQKKAALIMPAATSTPGKLSEKRSVASAKDETEVINKDRSSGSPVDGSDIPRVFSQISGRRSIRPLESFTPSKYNSQFRESYRRINTELDVTGTTNTSMNVTVGSEIPNNSSFLSFSLFGRGRKRERTPPSTMPAKSQSAVELTTETTPPKRPRLDVNGIFTAMSSPLTLLRSRFSKTTLESSTPAKLKEPNVATAEDDVQNVSGVSIEEVVCNSKSSAEFADTQQDITVGKEAIPETTPNKKSSPMKKKKAGKDIGDEPATNDEANESKEAPAMDVDSDIQMKETPIIAAVGDPKAKQRGCTIM